MPTAGYSGTPLIRKLGIRAGDTIALINAPADYSELIGPLPEGAKVRARLSADTRFIHLFAHDRATLMRELPRAKRALAMDGTLWISWPKKAAGIPTDVTETIVRETGLATGLVDVKICAVDETWSGLKFVYRLRDRERHI
jgi:hypothetical protein